MIHIGMDLHQKTTTWFACDETGERIASGKVDSGSEGWAADVQRLEQPLQVVIETGTTTWWCVDVLRELGVEPIVVDARQFKLIASPTSVSGARPKSSASGSTPRSHVSSSSGLIQPTCRRFRASGPLPCWPLPVRSMTHGALPVAGTSPATRACLPRCATAAIASAVAASPARAAACYATPSPKPLTARYAARNFPKSTAAGLAASTPAEPGRSRSSRLLDPPMRRPPEPSAKRSMKQTLQTRPRGPSPSG